MKKLNQQEFENLVKKLMLQELKSNSVKENFDDDDLGIYGGGFDSHEFDNDAMNAARHDITASGDEFVPLGKSKFEKNLNPNKFKKDLERASLDLPSDQDELNKIRQTMAKKSAHEKQFGVGSLNENGDWFDEGPQPGDAEYHIEKPTQLKGIGKFNDIDWQVLHETLVANTEYKETGHVTGNPNYMEAGVNDLTDYDGLLSKEELNLLENHDIVEIFKHYPIIADKRFLDYNTFMEAVKTAWAKGFINTDDDSYSEKERAYFRGSEGSGGMEEIANPGYKMERPVDAEGNPIALKLRVEHPETGAVGRIERLGVDDNGRQTVHVEWIQNFGGQVPPTITYPDKIVVRDKRVVRENGMEENLDQAVPADEDNELLLVIDDAFNRSHYKDLIGKTFPDAPPGYAHVKVVTPEQVAAEAAKYYDAEEQPKAELQEVTHNELVNEWPGKKVKILIGPFADYPKHYGVVKTADNYEFALKKTDGIVHSKFPNGGDYKPVRKTGENSYDVDIDIYDEAGKKVYSDTYEFDYLVPVKSEQASAQEGFDYAAAEREHHGKQELDAMKQEASNYVPESLIQFLEPDSFNMTKPNDDGMFSYSYTLRIKKQSNETLKDIEAFVKEEESPMYVGPGQSYKKVNIYTELEKIPNIWVIKVDVTRGLDI